MSGAWRIIPVSRQLARPGVVGPLRNGPFYGLEMGGDPNHLLNFDDPPSTIHVLLTWPSSSSSLYIWN